ncbi:hypothetical protein [Brevundimonas sp.]|uniref:hypothetical protein n=1 Tax=Brevundimonas sp. TaxID=1871086 RepID=UPI00289BA665|nr:hypothetical protein [Brevundimonas sp.]
MSGVVLSTDGNPLTGEDLETYHLIDEILNATADSSDTAAVWGLANAAAYTCLTRSASHEAALKVADEINRVMREVIAEGYANGLGFCTCQGGTQ